MCERQKVSTAAALRLALASLPEIAVLTSSGTDQGPYQHTLTIHFHERGSSYQLAFMCLLQKLLSGCSHRLRIVGLPVAAVVVLAWLQVLFGVHILGEKGVQSR